MGCDWIKVRAPGSVMLFGEHAVLAGTAAMMAAVDHTLTVTVEKRLDDKIELTSNIFPAYNTSLKNLEIIKPYTFVLACLLQQKVSQGLTIHIESEIDPTLGLGSSAAVTVAMLKALTALFQFKTDIGLDARTVIRRVQGHGSGMDALASLYGGVLYYSPEIIQPVILAPRSDLHLVYCGYKTPTATVLQHVQDTFHNAKNVLNAIYNAIGETVQLAYTAWQQADTELIKHCMQIHHDLQRTLRVSDVHSERLCHWLKERVHVEAVKISGSGLGDCLLTLGGDWQKISPEEVTALHPNARCFPLKISTTGVSFVQ